MGRRLELLTITLFDLIIVIMNYLQIIEPHDRLICQLAYEHHAEPNVNIWNIDNVHDHPLFLNADSAIEHYFADAKKFNYYQ